MSIRRLGNDLRLGRLAAGGQHLILPAGGRDKHLYICGATGVGKSKFLEWLIRQDILAWPASRCGLILLDPHGSLYDAVLAYLARRRLRRPLVLVDLRQDQWIIAYNLLRRRQAASPAVVVDAVVMAMAHVWGQGGTDQTPLFARWASNIVQTLYEKNHTLVEAVYLMDDPAIRQAMTAGLQDKLTGRDWRLADAMSRKELEQQLSSTINRFQRFLRNDTMRAIFGQPQLSLDFGPVLEEGSIVLVSLATERARVSRENADLFGTLLLTDLWTAAQERGKRPGVKPFYVYVDEFQKFVCPMIADGLDEARGFGLHFVMAHQFPNQLLDRGEDGRRLYNSIMENASSKVVFRLSHEPNLRPLAQWLFTGVMDPEEVKLRLYSTKVMQYREEERLSHSSSQSETEGGSSSSSSGTASGWGESMGYSHPYDRVEDGIESHVQASSGAQSSSSSESESWSRTTS